MRKFFELIRSEFQASDVGFEGKCQWKIREFVPASDDGAESVSIQDSPWKFREASVGEDDLSVRGRRGGRRGSRRRR